MIKKTFVFSSLLISNEEICGVFFKMISLQPK